MARETDCRPVFRSALRRRVESNLDGSASKREVSWLAAADRADSAAGVVFVRPSSSAGWVVAVGCAELNADDPEAVVAGAVGWVSCPLVWAGAVGCEAGLVFCGVDSGWAEAGSVGCVDAAGPSGSAVGWVVAPGAVATVTGVSDDSCVGWSAGSVGWTGVVGWDADSSADFCAVGCDRVGSSVDRCCAADVACVGAPAGDWSPS